MTWTETHERHRIIREVEAAASADPSGALPWREEYAALFGDRDGLLTALRSRWDRTCQAQLDSRLSDVALDETYRQLRKRHAGILRVLERYPAPGRSTMPAGEVAHAS